MYCINKQYKRLVLNMKRCPNCNDAALYDNAVELCPVCNSRLVAYTRRNESQNDETSSQQVRYAEPVQFETKNGNTYTFRGMVSMVSTQQRWSNRTKRILNSVFRNEPFQFGNTSQECVIRIEEFRTDDALLQMRDVIFYGEAEGRVVFGDDVTITAKRRNGRFIVTSLRVNDTGADIKPAVQISSGVLKAVFAFATLSILYIAVGLISLIATGSFARFLGGVLGWIITTAFKVFGIFTPFVLAFALLRAIFKR